MAAGYIIVIIFAVLFFIYLYMIFPARMPKERRKIFARRNYAHRGLFDNEKGVPENSLSAFEAAMRGGYGCELDVQLTKDKKIVVFHDTSYKRACGVDKNVWELDYGETKSFRLFNTQEKVPLLSEVLELIAGRGSIIIEIKAEKLDKGWYNELCAAVLGVLRGYQGDWCVESFSPHVVRWFYKNARDVTRGQLVMGRRFHKGIPFYVSWLYVNLLFNFCNRPHFIAYEESTRNFALRVAKRLGAMSVAWTVKNIERYDAVIEKEDAVIFEGFCPGSRY